MQKQPLESADDKSKAVNSQEPIPRTVWVLGVVMFMSNMSYLMVYSVQSIYLRSLLGVSVDLIGLLEGIAEGLSFVMKLLSGVFSDYLSRRKPVMVVGYLISVLSRPVWAISNSFMLVSVARMMERVGNGTQATPRDAMVADIAPPKRIGAAYGLKRSLATLGSFFGAIVCIFAMKITGENYQQLFMLACIPSFTALIILILFVKEPKNKKHPAISAEAPSPAPKVKAKVKFSQLPLLGRAFWLLMIVNAVFMLSRFGETFLVLHGNGNLGLSATYAPLVMIIFNASWCAASYPIGLLADKMNRYYVLLVGIIFIVMSDMVMATADSIPLFFLGVVFWGIQYGITSNIFTTLIAETVPEDLRGTGFGCYYIISAASAFICDMFAGKIARNFGFEMVFITSGIVALISLLTLVIIMGYKKRHSFRKSY